MKKLSIWWTVGIAIAAIAGTYFAANKMVRNSIAKKLPATADAATIAAVKGA